MHSKVAIVKHLCLTMYPKSFTRQTPGRFLTWKQLVLLSHCWLLQKMDPLLVFLARQKIEP